MSRSVSRLCGVASSSPRKPYGLEARAAEREGGGFHERRLELEEPLAELEPGGPLSKKVRR